MSLQFHALPVKSVARDADALVVGLGVPAPLREAFAFEPGQYLTLRADVGGEDLRRSYSICSTPDDAEMRVGIRLLPGGAFSGWAAEHLAAGQTLQVMPPQGRFTLSAATADAAVRRHVLVIAAGSGLTPMLSLIRALLAREPRTRCTLVYGNRHVATMMFKEELEDLKDRHLQRFTLLPVFSREAQDALELLDHLGLDSAAVLGTSRGGMIGMYLVAVARARLRGLRRGLSARSEAGCGSPQHACSSSHIAVLGCEETGSVAYS
jgi:ring-1,2-phenylacetyl-CoA epoxidase subunit PaaE